MTHENKIKQGQGDGTGSKKLSPVVEQITGELRALNSTTITRVKVHPESATQKQVRIKVGDEVIDWEELP